MCGEKDQQPKKVEEGFKKSVLWFYANLDRELMDELLETQTG
jgi:hypothetical protein